MIIMKFGGTSLKDAHAFQNVASIINDNLHKKPMVVVSAIASTTNLLEKAIRDALKQDSNGFKKTIEKVQILHKKTIENLFLNTDHYKDYLHFVESEVERLITLLTAMETIKSEYSSLGHAILSIGEILSSYILANLLQQMDIKTKRVDARKIMITSKKKGVIHPHPGKIKSSIKQKVLPLIEAGTTIVTQGFIGATAEGTPTTLGRNGSDYSASLFGAALGVEEIQIWTDVDGILTADPSIIPSAKLLSTMTFDEASELAYFGARVLYPAAIQPAIELGISVRVLNTRFPHSAGTLITNKQNKEDHKIVKSIAYKEGISLLTIKSSQLLLSTKLMARFFSYLNKLGLAVYAISKSATKLSLTIESIDGIDKIIKDFNTFGETHLAKNKAIVSMVGENMKGNPDISWQVIKLLKMQNINIDLISQFSSQISFMFIINESDIEKTIKLIHEEYILPV